VADWSSAIAGNAWFSLVGDTAAPVTIVAFTPPGSSLSGFWEATLQETYSLPSVTAVDYVIHIDFTATVGLPLFQPGDVQRSQILNRALWLIDGRFALGGGGGGGGGGTGNMLVDFSIATLSQPKPSLWWKITVQDGVTVLQWWLLQTGAPGTHDVATSDDSTSRWRQVG
jgi:hypothetical protein